MPIRRFIALLLLLILTTRMQAQTARGTNDWRGRPLTLAEQKKTLPELLAIFAQQTGQNLLAEGEPPRKTVDLTLTDTAENALTQIANAFDYSWTVSQDGILLLTKKFKDRLTLPQFHAEELQEVADTMTASIHALVPEMGGSRSHNDYIVQMVGTLSLEDVAKLKQGVSLPVRSLSPAAQTYARQAVYNHLFQPVFNGWGRMAATLKALPQTQITRKVFIFTKPDGSEDPTEIIRLIGTDASGKSLTSDLSASGKADTDTPSLLDEGQLSSAPKAVSTPKLQHGEMAVSDLLAIIAHDTRKQITVPPTLKSRSLIVELHGAGLRPVLNALCELHHWTWKVADSGAYVLKRPEVRLPDSATAVAQTIRSVLPADIARFLSSDPDPKPGENRLFDYTPAMAAESVHWRVVAKLEERLNTGRAQLYQAIGATLRKDGKIAYAALNRREQELLLRILTLEVFETSLGTLTKSLTQLTTYQERPETSELFYKRSLNGGQIGTLLLGSESTPTQEGGAFGLPYNIETMTRADITVIKTPQVGAGKAP